MVEFHIIHALSLFFYDSRLEIFFCFSVILNFDSNISFSVSVCDQYFINNYCDLFLHFFAHIRDVHILRYKFSEIFRVPSYKPFVQTLFWSTRHKQRTIQSLESKPSFTRTFLCIGTTKILLKINNFKSFTS